MTDKREALSAEVWKRIKAYEGEVFCQKEGKEFTYTQRPNGKSLLISTSSMGINPADLEKALDSMPVEGPNQIKECHASNYIYGILMDKRIREGLY